MDFKEKIIQLRKKHNMTQEDLAKAINVSRKSIGLYEMGERLPRKNVVKKISEYFCVPVDYLMSPNEQFIMDATAASGARGKLTATEVINNAAALFAGGDVSDDDKEMVMKAIQDAYWDAKRRKKEQKK